MLLAVRVWILLSALLAGAGWVLSALHQLNRTGYSVVFALAAAALFFWRWKIQGPIRERCARAFHKFPRRFKRPAPLLFLMLASLSFISGLLYAPHNSDTLSYRLPRVLHWLGQEQWHWIHSADMRINVSACGYEWFVAPALLFTGTVRSLFLINWIPYLMVPGLAFYVLKCMGVRPRVAWWWAWLLSSGWCYVLQSASVANDSFGVAYALASVALAVKSRQSGRVSDFWLSMLAAGLTTGVKQTLIPLFALWMVAAWPGRRLASAHRKTFVVMAALSLLVSVVPIIICNFIHTGTWSGFAAIQAYYPEWHIQLNSPFWGIVGNAFYIPLLNLLPPVFPWSGAWNRAMDSFANTSFGAHFKEFEHFGKVDAGISETSAGIGLALVLMTVVSICAARRHKGGPRVAYSRLQCALRWCPWILLLIFMAEVGETQISRFLAAYYIFLFPSLLGNPGHEMLVRQRWWQNAALACMASSILLLVVNTPRPLFPAVTITGRLAAAYPRSNMISMFHHAYAASRSFGEGERELRERMPPNEPVVGYAALGNGELEPALWLPLGIRRVRRVISTDGPGQLAREGIHDVVIENLPSLDCTNIDKWMTRYHANLISDFTFQDKAHDNSTTHAYIMRLNDK